MKMKTFTHFLLTLLIAYVAGMVLPWWSVAVVAFLVTLLIPLTPGKAFSSGFMGVFILWLVLAFYMDVRNDHILANRMSEMILHVKSAPMIGVISALIGGLVAGLAALTASFLRAPKAA
jgi:hypothetical protein